MAYPYPQYYPPMQQPPYQQGAQAQQMQVNGMLVRPVASVEEARGMQTDFNGQLTIMPDLSHGYIYTKRLNPQTFEADIVAYQRVEVPAAAPAQSTPDLSEYVKKTDFDSLVGRFNTLLDQLGGGGNANAQ